MSPTRTASEKGSGWPFRLGRPRCSIAGRFGAASAVLVMANTPAAIVRMRFMSAPPFALIHHLAGSDAPDVRCADIAFALADRHAAPAARAFVDPADYPVLREVAHLCAVARLESDRPRVARLDDR